MPPDDREGFSLSYYPVDADYRFVVTLHEHDDPETVTVETTTGETREYLEWGEFVVELEGQSVAIQAHRGDPDEERLWVPFRDATSGEATYGAGRYIGLESDDRSGDGRWVLDFNEAYNPTCAYAPEYSCPLPPTANWLDGAIEAGEQTPH
jgi:uncharacterized protein (DUF1684 family)